MGFDKQFVVSAAVVAMAALGLGACARGAAPTASDGAPVRSILEAPAANAGAAETAAADATADPESAPTEVAVTPAPVASVAGPNVCTGGSRYVPDNPVIGGVVAATGNQSLFAAAAAGGIDGGSDRISVQGERGNRIFRAARLNRPVDTLAATRRAARQSDGYRVADIDGAWSITDGDPVCACTIILGEGGDGETMPASVQSCQAPNLARVANWRLRGKQVVLLASDRSLIGAFDGDDDGVLRGSFSNGLRGALWR